MPCKDIGQQKHGASVIYNSVGIALQSSSAGFVLRAIVLTSFNDLISVVREGTQLTDNGGFLTSGSTE
jgi:hypothetical protein